MGIQRWEVRAHGSWGKMRSKQPCEGVLSNYPPLSSEALPPDVANTFFQGDTYCLYKKMICYRICRPTLTQTRRHSPPHHGPSILNKNPRREGFIIQLLLVPTTLTHGCLWGLTEILQTEFLETFLRIRIRRRLCDLTWSCEGVMLTGSQDQTKTWLDGLKLPCTYPP